MTTKLRISRPHIPKDAKTLTPKSAYNEDLPAYSATTGKRHNFAALETAENNTFIDFDAGSTISNACDHLVIARADLLQQDDVNVVTLKGSDSPRNMPELTSTAPTLWLKASDGVTADAQRRVSSWADQSGNGYDFTQSTDANKPLITRADNKENLVLDSNDPASAKWQNLSAGTGSAPVITAAAGTDPDGGNAAVRVQLDLNGGTTSGDYSGVRARSVLGSLPGGGIPTGYYGSLYVKSYDGVSTYDVGWQKDGTQNMFQVTGDWTLVTVLLEGASLKTVNFGIWLRGNLVNDDAVDLLFYNLVAKHPDADDDRLITGDYMLHRGVNGLPALRFDGSNDTMLGVAVSSLVSSSAYTIFTVIAPEPSAASRIIDYTTSGRPYINVAANNIVSAADHDGSWRSANSPTAAVDSEANIIATRHDTGDLYVEVNGGGEGSGTCGNTTPSGSWELSGYGSGLFTGKICEYIIYNVALSAADRALMYEYLAAKYTRTPTVSNTSFDSETLIGPDAHDYITTFTESTAYRYWWLDYSVDFGTSDSKFPRSKEYFGTLVDLDRNPTAYDYKLVDPGVTEVVFPTGNIFVAESRDPRYIFSVRWDGVNDADTQTFLDNVMTNPHEQHVFLYTTDNDQILADNQLVHVKLDQANTTIRRTSTADWNIITAVFEQVVG